MSCSLIPERPIQVSPSLAATIGLEEAAMLTLLDDISSYLVPQWQQGLNWYSLHEPILAERMPFWTDHDIQRVSQSLRARGVLLLQSAPFCQSRQLVFAFNEQVQSPAPGLRGLPVYNAPPHVPAHVPVQAQPQAPLNTPVPAAAVSRGATLIPPNWQPSSDVLAAIAQHNIPDSFIREQIAEFVNFWRESGESHRSWGAKFQQQVMRKWREHENFVATREQETPMTAGWQPSRDALEVMVKHAGISRQFVEDAIPEFVLYWSERAELSRTWNSKFIQHVRRQWARYTSALEHDSEPKRIPENWQPSADVYDVLKLANIDLNFARMQVQEFTLFWRDSNQVYASWNTKFLQHVKYHWARRHALSTPQGNHYAGTTATPARTRDRSLVDDLNDRSWAQ
jgi:hypothetical protein